MPVTSSSYGNYFAISFSVERTAKYSVFCLAWLFEICFLIIIDCIEIFLTASQLAVGYDVNVLDFYQIWEITSITFLSYRNCKIYRALIGPLEVPHAVGEHRSISFIRLTVNSPLAAGL
jgi:hypothetical protein